MVNLSSSVRGQNQTVSGAGREARRTEDRGDSSRGTLPMGRYCSAQRIPAARLPASASL